MANQESPKHYDLEERTYEFARDVRSFIRKLGAIFRKTEGNK